MRINRNLLTLGTKALVESLDLSAMKYVMREIISNYNIHERTGIPESMAITKLQAARQIIEDINSENLFPQLVTLLMEIHEHGHMGRKFRISYLNEILKDIYEQGFIYEREHKVFMENPRIRRTKNWGSLQNNKTYSLSFLKLDIADNSNLVKNYPSRLIDKTYLDFREIVQEAVHKRNGRIWRWEGDGGLIAFHFGNKHLTATMTAINILHDLLLYNSLYCKLDVPLGVRLAVHSGNCLYNDNLEDLKNMEIIKKVVMIEEKSTETNTITISSTVKMMLDPIISRLFNPANSSDQKGYYFYKLRWVE